MGPCFVETTDKPMPNARDLGPLPKTANEVRKIISLKNACFPKPPTSLRKGDDYFDLYGRYLGSDPGGRNRIVVVPHMGQHFFDERCKFLLPLARQLSEIPFHTLYARSLANGIMGTYHKALGLKSGTQFDVRLPTAKEVNDDAIFMLATHPTKPLIRLTVTRPTMRMHHKPFDNKFNLANAIVHEQYHVEHDRGLESEERILAEEHAYAYAEQFRHPTWRYVTKEHRIKIGGSFAYTVINKLELGSPSEIKYMKAKMAEDYQIFFPGRFQTTSFYGDLYEYSE